MSSIAKLNTRGEFKFAPKGDSCYIDIPGAEWGKVVTRFPPEPSGYMHIGHAKAALLNYTIASKFGGHMILRFDDTNPSKEKGEYVDNILKDLAILGIEYKELSHTSQHFDYLLECGTKMLENNKAYIDQTPVDQMRKERMDGTKSQYRDRSLAENIAQWKEMIAGTEQGCLCVMRAKIDMQAKNKALRDPTLFRCNVKTPHHRTGSRYKVYPTYDFACPIVDSHEGVTHAFRTSEYQDRNEQYAWIIAALGLRPVHVCEYSRLNFVYTVLSKRKLQWFIDNGVVDSWADPRFPTIQGIIRRGMTVTALKEFMKSQGANKSNNLMEWDKIWSINKRIIDPTAHRYNAVALTNRVIVNILNYPHQGFEVVAVPLHPKIPSGAKKSLLRSDTVIIEQEDAQLLTKDMEVTMMSWGNVIVRNILRDDTTGTVTSITAELNLKGNPSLTRYKLHWVACDSISASSIPSSVPETKTDAINGRFPPPLHAVPTAPWSNENSVSVTLVEFDTLLTVPKPEEDKKFADFVRSQTQYDTPAIGEGSLRNVAKGDIIQLQRRGFYICDRPWGGATEPCILFLIPDGKQKAMSGLSLKVGKKTATMADTNNATKKA